MFVYTTYLLYRLLLLYHILKYLYDYQIILLKIILVKVHTRNDNYIISYLNSNTKYWSQMTLNRDVNCFMLWIYQQIFYTTFQNFSSFRVNTHSNNFFFLLKVNPYILH